MNLFASDLDQTLIYSEKWLKNTECSVKRIEGDEKSFSSYMLQEAYDELSNLMSNHSFIPITTRTLNQFNRIRFAKHPKIAVVANGAMILIDGQRDLEWDKEVQSRLKGCEPISSMENRLSSLLKLPGVEKLKSADDYFLYMITDTDIFNAGILASYRAELKEAGWSIYNQGKKVYFIPAPITKGAALRYLIKKNHYKKIVAAGDSLLDESMGEDAHYFIVPKHSELLGDYKCRRIGIESGLEIIQQAFNCLETSD